jgi:chorismate synthase
MNRFGVRFAFTTFGESHGKAIGVVIDGVPAGLKIDEDFIQSEMDRRKPGKTKFETSRKEDDKIEILSGTFEGLSTGTPISMVIFNKNQKSKDYSNVKDVFRPGHADFTYFHKYGVRDYRGGGRSSARETAGRVATGAIAKLILKDLGIKVNSGIFSVNGIDAEQIDFSNINKSEIFAVDPVVENAQKNEIIKAKNNHDSVGGTVLVSIQNAPVGLGEPIYYKLDSILADAMMSINAVKGVEIGIGGNSTKILGSENNDPITSSGFMSNNAGGILGGISNGEEILMKVHFKPTPSIFVEQDTVNEQNQDTKFSLKGRHDPCVAVRGSVVAEAMASIVIVDMLLLNMGRTLNGLKKYYEQ